MPPPVWKQLLKKDDQSRFAQFHESTEAYELMEVLVAACDAHLAATSLEFLASGCEDVSSALPAAATLVMAPAPELQEAHRRLTELFLAEFQAFNEHRLDNRPNRNELCFLVLMQYHYCVRGRQPHWAVNEPALRFAPPEQTYRDLLDSRCRLAEAMCRHGHLVSGQPYETRRSRAQRRRETRMDMVCPTEYSLVEWHEMRKRQQDEDAAEELADRGAEELVRQAAERRRRQRPDHDDDAELVPIGDDDGDGPVDPGDAQTRSWPAPAPYPGDEPALADEVSFFATCYYSTVGGVDAPSADVDAAPDMQQVRSRLTNAATGTGTGLLWDPAQASTLYLPMATQLFAQLWTERRWRHAHPTVEVDVDTAPFLAFVADRMETEIQDGQVKELSFNIYSLLLPIGAKGLAKRVWGGAGSSMRTLLNRMSGSAIIHEIDELFDTQAAIKLIGYDAAHPLQDALCMVVAQMGCWLHDNDFSMVSRCTVPADQVMGQQHKARLSPVIVKLCGEWVVLSKGQWHKPREPNTFAAAWLVYLTVLKRDHKFSVDTVSNLSYWEQVLGCRL